MQCRNLRKGNGAGASVLNTWMNGEWQRYEESGVKGDIWEWDFYCKAPLGGHLGGHRLPEWEKLLGQRDSEQKRPETRVCEHCSKVS